MNVTYRCGDHEGLIAFVYGECDPTEREAVAAHVAVCASCREEADSLRSTRTALAAWAPPDVSLGFQISQAVGREERVETPVLRPVAWWRQPLPAWAQAAAAAAIFAAGLAAGNAGRQPSPAPAVTQSAQTVTPAPTRTVAAELAPSVSRDDVAQLERRLRALETGRIQTAATRTVPASMDEAALFERVDAMIAASEQRQRAANGELVEAVARNIAQQRQVDLQQVEKRFGEIYNTTGNALRQQGNAINSLVRTVSFQPQGR
jgi:hypothetical protein